MTTGKYYTVKISLPSCKQLPGSLYPLWLLQWSGLHAAVTDSPACIHHLHSGPWSETLPTPPCVLKSSFKMQFYLPLHCTPVISGTNSSHCGELAPLENRALEDSQPWVWKAGSWHKLFTRVVFTWTGELSLIYMYNIQRNSLQYIVCYTFCTRIGLTLVLKKHELRVLFTAITVTQRLLLYTMGLSLVDKHKLFIQIMNIP